ncbi:MAG: glycosyltransferase, partial [Acidimicrobiales bacterium]
VMAGAVDESTKWDLLHGAVALVSPSAYESFSLAIMEAWTARLPVIVNACCQATRESCERSGGCLWFRGYAQFEVILDRVLSDARLRDILAERGRRYVDTNFRWPVIIDRYSRFLSQVAEKVH